MEADIYELWSVVSPIQWLQVGFNEREALAEDLQPEGEWNMAIILLASSGYMSLDILKNHSSCPAALSHSVSYWLRVPNLTPLTLQI